MKVKEAICNYLKTITLGTQFQAIEMIHSVRNQTARPSLYDGTILRIFRILKKEGKVNYIVVNKSTSTYSLLMRNL